MRQWINDLLMHHWVHLIIFNDLGTDLILKFGRQPAQKIRKNESVSLTVSELLCLTPSLTLTVKQFNAYKTM
jgi:hypothetical protein